MIALCKVAAGVGKVEIRDVPRPRPAFDEVLIRVNAAGICGSDLKIYNWDTQVKMAPPVIMGHEFSGVVEELGSETGSLKIGDRVTAEPTYSVCGRCYHCQSGFYNLCLERKVLGFAVDGAFAQYIRVPARRVHRLPENVDFWAGAMTEPLACCVHGVFELGKVNVGDLAVVSGPGAIGLICVQLLKLAGARVLVTGTQADAQRLALAKKLGADYAFEGKGTDISRTIRDLTEGLGADMVVECSGSEMAASSGLELIRKRGRYVQVGLFGRPIMLDFEKVAYKEIQVTGSFAQKWSAWKTSLLLMAEKKVHLNPLVSDVLPLLEWGNGFDKLNSKQGLKIILTP